MSPRSINLRKKKGRRLKEERDKEDSVEFESKLTILVTWLWEEKCAYRSFISGRTKVCVVRIGPTINLA